MAKRENRMKLPESGMSTPDTSGSTTMADAMEQRLMAFAEQLGRMAGAIQAKAQDLVDRETLNTQIASVRDTAGRLLEQLAGAATAAVKTKASKKKPTAATARRGNKGRSGGVVDAPGKKHRKRTPTDPGANRAGSQAAKVRTAKTMVKTNRHRGRG